MTDLSEGHKTVIRRAQKLLDGAADSSRDFPEPLAFPDWEALDRYTRSALLELRLDESLEITAQTLRAISAALAEAHVAAAAVVVAAPSAADIADYKAKLEAVSRDVQLDQRSRQLTAFAGKLADMVSALA